MIIELVLVIPRSTGLDSKLGEPDGARSRAAGRQSKAKQKKPSETK